MSTEETETDRPASPAMYCPLFEVEAGLVGLGWAPTVVVLGSAVVEVPAVEGVAMENGEVFSC